MTAEYSTELSALLTGPEAAATPQRTINFKRLFRMRLKGMIIVSVALALPSALAVWFLVPVKYTATAVITCAATQRKILESEERGTPGQVFERYLASQVNIIQGTGILDQVVADAKIRTKLPWLKEQPDPVYFLRDNLFVTNTRGTELISVSFSAEKAVDAKLLVEIVIDKYLESLAKVEQGLGSNTLVELARVREDIEADIALKRKSIENMRKAVDAPSQVKPGGLSVQLESYYSNRSAAEAGITSTETAIALKQSQIDRLKALQENLKGAPNVPILDFEIEAKAKADTQVNQLRASLAQVDEQITILRGKYQESAPQLHTEDQRRLSVQAALDTAMANARLESLKTELARKEEELVALNTQLDTAKKQRDQFDALIADRQKEDSRLAQEWDKIAVIEKDVQFKEADLKRVTDRIDTLEIEGSAPARVRESSPASVPNSPDMGKRLQLVVLALAASTGVGLGFGLWRELADQELRSAQDISYITKVPVLSSIPHASVDKLSTSDEPARYALEHPDSPTADEYRRVITRVIYPPEGSGEINTCLVTSPSRGDGKTSLACNLAIALAQANRRVLLIDINSRDPAVERNLGLDPDVGLSEVLSEGFDAASVFRATQVTNLWVIGPGFHGADLVGKLASRDMVEFLETCEGQFEHVVIDSPPSLLMSDAKLLAPVVDGVIVVVGVGKTKIGMLRRCLQEMNQIGANVVGVVMNGIRPYSGGYLGKNLDMYYNFGSGEQNSSKKRRTSASPRGSSHGIQDIDEPMVMLVDDAPPDDEQDGTKA